MSLGCAGCGDCCDPVHLAPDVVANVDYWRELAEDAWAGAAPTGDVAWVLVHLVDGRPAVDGGVSYRCDRFDPDARACTAYDERPDMCSKFPAYIGVVEPRICPPSCSYLLDVDPADRPANSRPLIPLEVL